MGGSSKGGDSPLDDRVSGVSLDRRVVKVKEHTSVGTRVLCVCVRYVCVMYALCMSVCVRYVCAFVVLKTCEGYVCVMGVMGRVDGCVVCIRRVVSRRMMGLDGRPTRAIRGRPTRARRRSRGRPRGVCRRSPFEARGRGARVDSIRFDSIRFDSIRFDSFIHSFIHSRGDSSTTVDWIGLDWIG